MLPRSAAANVSATPKCNVHDPDAPPFVGDDGLFACSSWEAIMMWKVAFAAAAGLPALAPAIAVKGLGDAEVAHVAYTAGVIDVAAGKQALAKSRNEAVRAFAEEMVRDHG